MFSRASGAGANIFGSTVAIAGASVSRAGRSRLPICPFAHLTDIHLMNTRFQLKHEHEHHESDVPSAERRTQDIRWFPETD
jgi:hypothetical protein